MRILVVASHSGGHILPAVAFCQGLKDKDNSFDIKFITTDGQLERQIIGNGVDAVFFKKRKVAFLTSYRLLGLFFRVRALIHKLKPDLVVGFGGYLSIPFIICAKLSGIPNFIHEQNVKLGLANWFLLGFADKIVFSFPNTQVSDRIKAKSLFLGLPLRKELKRIDKNEARRYFDLDQDCFTILVTGGSQGSYRINNQVLEVLKDKDIYGIQVIHLTGSFEYERFVREYKTLNIKYKVFKFIERMDCAFSAADLVITRAGANTIAELVATRTAAVLIPYPYARAHQLDNARFLTDKAAALLIEDSRLDKDILKETILDLKNNPQKLKIMSEKLAAIDMPDARNKMAVLAWELANARN